MDLLLSHTRRSAKAALFLLFLLLSAVLANSTVRDRALAQSQILTIPEVTVTPLDIGPLDALETQTVTFEHTITYTGDTSIVLEIDESDISNSLSDTYFDIVEPATFPVIFNLSNIVPTATYRLRVRVPTVAEADRDAILGKINTTTTVIHEQGQANTVTLRDETKAISYDVTLGFDQQVVAAPGDSVQFTLPVQNVGTEDDRYSLSKVSGSLNTQFEQTLVDLAGGDTDETGATDNVTVTIFVPSDATTGTKVTTIRATSLDDPLSPIATAEVDLVIDVQGGADDNLYADEYEPNNTLGTATEIVPTASGATLTDFTLWPVGDIDYLTFYGKAGSTYRITTSNLSSGLDTYLTAYDRAGNVITANDDYLDTNRASQVTITTGQDGYYFFSIINLDATDPVNRTYDVTVTEVLATPTPTPAVGGDQFEPNGTFAEAALIQLKTTYNLDFQPYIPPGPDNDYFKVWVKAGNLYSCVTTVPATGPTDTNMIFYDQNFNTIAGNDDRAPGDFGSEIEFFSWYTGWLYILVGPFNLPETYESAADFTYTLNCDFMAATRTPTPTLTPTPTNTPVPFGGGGLRTATPTPTPLSSSATETPTFLFPTAQPTPTPTPRPIVVFSPLPTATPPVQTQPEVTVDVTLYYDENGNFAAELDEGIEDVGVALYDNVTGMLLAFGYTNQAGTVMFGPVSADGSVRVVIPFLGISQTVSDASGSIVLRVAPQTLPDQIP